MQAIFGYNSYKEKQPVGLRGLAIQQFYSDERNKGATLKISDIEKIEALIIEKAEQEGKLQTVEEDEEEQLEEDQEEVEATVKIMQAAKRQIAPATATEEVKAAPEDEPEVVEATEKVKTAKQGAKKPAVEEEDEGLTQKMPPKRKGGAPVAQAPAEPIKEEDKEEDDDEEEQTKKANVAKKEKNINDAYQPNINGLQLPANVKVGQRVLTKRAQSKAYVSMKIREAYDIKEIKPVLDDQKDHELIFYQGKRIIHAEAFEDYKNESDYKDNTKLLLKRACQKQTIHKTEIETFEAQDTTDKVENFLKKYSRYFKDVVNIAQLAKGGEAIVYTLEHSLPDELIIKCPVLTKDQQEKTLATAFNGILYESQTLNLNPHRGHVVNNVEEIILFNEKLGVITNYCVIVERAKYTLENVAAYWTNTKDKKTNWTYENQDFYTSEKLSFYFFQTMIATQYFHFKNIYYGDMKGANLLIFRNQEVKIGDLGISLKLKPLEKEGDEDDTDYHLKGSTSGYVIPEISTALSKQLPVKRPILIRNDQYAIQVTFTKTLITLQRLQQVKDDCAAVDKKPYFLDMLHDISLESGMNLKQCVEKWGKILDDDVKFRNKLCDQLRLEYKFLGLPKVHLLLDQNLMANFYLNKQIVYKREIEEDNVEDKVVKEKFQLHQTGRDEKFPYSKPKNDQKDLTEEQQTIQQNLQEEQIIKEKIDFFWALKAAKSTQDDINKELNNILEKELGLERKRINDKMHDFKDFEIKKAIANEKKSLEQIKILDAISGPNNEGFQMELQHKLCFEIAKGIKKNNMANYFLKRVEQIFILEFEEEGKESSFKEQHVKRLKDQIRETYASYASDKEFRHTIQFAFYSYFMYKDLKSRRNGKTRESLLKQIDYLIESMKIFKNLMGENIELQNQMIHKKAIAHMLIQDEENYEKAQQEFKRLYLTKKSLESFHDYAYSFYKWQDKRVASDKIKEVAREQKIKAEDVVLSEKDLKEIKEEVERLMRFKYDLQSGFLLFKEFFNEYYQYVPNYGLENKKIRDRLDYLKYQDYEKDQDAKDPVKFLQYFTKFLKQINDNSTEDISQKRTHLHSYETFLPKKSFLKLKYRQFNMEEIDIQKSILSDDVEFLLNQQRDKITLKKLTFHFDINKQVVCIDSEFWNSRTKKLYKTDHYKELKKTEVSIDIPAFVYPIALNIINNEVIKKKQDQKIEKKEGEEEVIQIWDQYVMVQLSNFKIIQVTSEKPIELDIYDKEFSNMPEIEKTQVLFNRLTKPFNDFIIGTFQHYNPVKIPSLSIQNYFVKMSKRQYIISLMRYCFKKLQIVNHKDQIDKEVDSLIVYQDKFLFTKELLENEKIMEDIEKGNNSFNWLFSQEKLLNQRKANFKQYMKDVRNHLVYHMREYFTDGETEDLGLDEGEEVQESDAVTKLREQMGKAIDVLKCFDDAVKKMKDGIRQRYKFEVKKEGSNEAGNVYNGTIQLGYSIVDKKAEFKEAGKLEDLEQKIYFHQIGVLLRFTQHKGYKVESITSIQFGPDYLLIDLKYTQMITKGEQGKIISSSVDLLSSSFYNLLKTYVGDKIEDFSILKEIEARGEEDARVLIAAWKSDMATNLELNLNLVMKKEKEKIFPHFMRVIQVPFRKIFQSELYSYQIKGEEEVKHSYNENEMILLHLMLLKIQYKTKTPSNTIRKLKYKTKSKFNPEVLTKMLEEKKSGDSEESKQLYQFVKEHIFKYHVFDTFPELLNQWSHSIQQHYQTNEFADYTNQFFYTSYDYYSINISVLQKQMEDLFSVFTPVIIKECIQKIFQIVLARIQGSLKENQDTYIKFLEKYYPGDDEFEKIRAKINEYITSEYEDDDYKLYEEEFKEYDLCGQTIKTIKEAMHPTKHTPEKLAQPEELKSEYTRIINDKLTQVVDLLKQVDLAQIFDKSRNVVVIAFTHSAKKQVIEGVNKTLIGNILLKKILLKASHTKHRIFGQHRIIKKYIESLKEVVSKNGAYIEVMKDLSVVINKNLEVTLVEQYDHNYLPKWKEVFNRLDDHHRFTNFDDFELIVNELAKKDMVLKKQQFEEMKAKSEHRDHLALDLDPERSEFFENKFVVIDRYPTIKQLKFFIDEAGNVIHIAALYRLNGEDIKGEGYLEGGVTVDLADDEVLDDISVPEGSINIKSFKLTLGKNGGDRTEYLTFADDFSQVRNPVAFKEGEDKLSRRVLSFSGLKSDKGLLNFNLYFYKCKESPEEKHLFIDQDSDAEDYFNDDQD